MYLKWEEDDRNALYKHPCSLLLTLLTEPDELTGVTRSHASRIRIVLLSTQLKILAKNVSKIMQYCRSTFKELEPTFSFGKKI